MLSNSNEDEETIELVSVLENEVRTQLVPNPNNGEFSVVASEAISKIHIFDLTGKEVYSTQLIEGNSIELKPTFTKVFTFFMLQL